MLNPVIIMEIIASGAGSCCTVWIGITMGGPSSPFARALVGSERLIVHRSLFRLRQLTCAVRLHPHFHEFRFQASVKFIDVLNLLSNTAVFRRLNADAPPRGSPESVYGRFRPTPGISDPQALRRVHA